MLTLQFSIRLVIIAVVIRVLVSEVRDENSIIMLFESSATYVLLFTFGYLISFFFANISNTDENGFVKRSH